jgi:hypothetical protein
MLTNYKIELPIQLDDDENLFKDYFDGLNLCHTEEDLSQFIIKWKIIYKLSSFPKDQYEDKRSATSIDNLHNNTTVNLNEILECIKIHRAQACCSHMTSYTCEGLHVSLPIVLLDALLIAKRFEVPPNIAFIQLLGGMPSFKHLFL